MTTPELTSKTVKCYGGELFKTLHDLEQSGWRTAMLKVKGTCEYELLCYLDWKEPAQTDLIEHNGTTEPTTRGEDAF